MIKGRVQGVGYRFFAIRAAHRLGVVGSVRNLADGTVEAIAEGTAEAVAEFRAELWRGPSYAQIAAVDEADLKPSGRYKSFDVEY
ncbi:MAG: acylphosphatase [Blastocatellia bacterium]